MIKLGFAMPHMLRLKATCQPWEAAVSGADQTRFIKWADQLGFEMASVPEHHLMPQSHVALSGPHHLNAITTMAYWAGATERIRVNSCVSLLPVQNPLITAKALSTMDWLSDGRVTVTFGVGWLKEEFDLLGVDYHQRGAMAEEYIQAIIALWTQERPEFEGKYVNFRDVAFEPRCVQTPHIPIWFGGDAKAVLRRTSRYASGWWPFLTKPEDIPTGIDYIKSQPDYNGKLSEVFYGLNTGRVGMGHVAQDDPEARPGMSRDQIIDRLGWFAELGVTWSAIPIPELQHIDEYFDYTQWIAEEIMPVVDGKSIHQ